MRMLAALHQRLGTFAHRLAERGEALTARLPWPHATLRTYLVAAMLLATVPIALLMAWQIASDLLTQQRRTETSLQRAAAALAREVERELVSSIDTLAILAQFDSIQRNDVAGFKQALLARSLLRASWDTAYLIDLDGAVVFDTAAPYARLGERRAATPLFRRVLEQGRPQVSDLVGDGRSDGPHHMSRYATAIEVPVVVDGTVRYVLGAWINATVWQALVERAGPPQQGFMSVFDRRYRLVARTLAPQRFVGSAMPPDAAQVIARSPTGLERVQTLDGGISYVAWQAVPMAGWGVAVALRAEPIEAAQREAIARAILTAAACLLLGVSLALWLARRVSQPLRRLATHGAASPMARIAVHEIALLRDALVDAGRQDELARGLLKAKADEFETLFANSPIGLAFAQDPQCRVVMHNAAMTAMLGPPQQGIEPAHVEVMHEGRALERAEQPLQLAAARGRTVSAMELEIRVAGRASTFVIASAVPLADPDGRPRGALGAVVDISERKLAEARLVATDNELRASQRLVDLAQQAGHVGFFNYRFDRDELVWTPGMALLFGVESAARGAPVASTLAAWIGRIDAGDRTMVEQALRRMLGAGQQTETLEFRVPLASGGERWLSSRVLMSYASDGRPLQMVGITLDMTEQKASERERAALVEREQAARQTAEASNRAKDEFLAMLGHELRNPLSAITSAAELLHRVEASAEVASSARAVITRQTRHLARLMDDLLDVGRVISGKILLSRSPVNLALLVERHASAVELTGDAAHHHVTLALAEVWIDADPTRVEQIVNNLLTNALKYTPAGGHIGLAVRRDGDEAVLEVSDTGVGIAESLLPRIFDLFVQGERTLDRRAGGLGVGLTLVRRLVELHGGSITAESSDAGSRFLVRLPAIEAPAWQRVPVRRSRTRERRVLVIEDNADALSTLCAMLELDGHSVTTATDGQAGLEALLAQRPDVAIVDIGLPGLTGYEVAKRSRAAGHAGRMIAVSGYGQPQDVKHSLQAGFDAHMVKPVAAQDLQTLLVQE